MASLGQTQGNSNKSQEYSPSIITFLSNLPPISPRDLRNILQTDQCLICFNQYSPPPSRKEIICDHPVKLPCGHIAGKKCLATWFQQGGNSCTMCQATVITWKTFDAVIRKRVLVASHRLWVLDCTLSLDRLQPRARAAREILLEEEEERERDRVWEREWAARKKSEEAERERIARQRLSEQEAERERAARNKLLEEAERQQAARKKLLAKEKKWRWIYAVLGVSMVVAFGCCVNVYLNGTAHR